MGEIRIPPEALSVCHGGSGDRSKKTTEVGPNDRGPMAGCAASNWEMAEKRRVSIETLLAIYPREEKATCT